MSLLKLIREVIEAGQALGTAASPKLKKYLERLADFEVQVLFNESTENPLNVFDFENRTMLFEAMEGLKPGPGLSLKLGQLKNFVSKPSALFQAFPDEKKTYVPYCRRAFADCFNAVPQLFVSKDIVNCEKKLEMKPEEMKRNVEQLRDITLFCHDFDRFDVGFATKNPVTEVQKYLIGLTYQVLETRIFFENRHQAPIEELQARAQYLEEACCKIKEKFPKVDSKPEQEQDHLKQLEFYLSCNWQAAKQFLSQIQTKIQQEKKENKKTAQSSGFEFFKLGLQVFREEIDRFISQKSVRFIEEHKLTDDRAFSEEEIAALICVFSADCTKDCLPFFETHGKQFPKEKIAECVQSCVDHHVALLWNMLGKEHQPASPAPKLGSGRGETPG